MLPKYAEKGVGEKYAEKGVERYSQGRNGGGRGRGKGERYEGSFFMNIII